MRLSVALMFLIDFAASPFAQLVHRLPLDLVEAQVAEDGLEVQAQVDLFVGPGADSVARRVRVDRPPLLVHELVEGGDLLFGQLVAQVLVE